MVSLRACRGTAALEVQVEKGALIHDALLGTPFEVRTGCNSNGSCGMCAILTKAGEFTPHTLPERIHLSSAELAEGKRLACQTRVLSDAVVDLSGARQAEGWRLMAMDEGHISVVEGRARSGELALCVDLGTSRLRISLVDMGSGGRLGAAAGQNPLPGTEVVSRLQLAVSGEGPAEAESLRRSLAEGLWFLLDAAGVKSEAVRRIIVVGNTAMLALLRGEGQEEVLSTASWTRQGGRDPIHMPGLGDDLGIPWAQAELLPPLGGFIGSDLLTGMVACELDADGPALLVDFGTNTEVALFSGDRLLATSAAGGSAFEGVGITCGARPCPGAVRRVHPTGDGGAELIVIGGGEPAGLTGSGLVDALAMLLARGAVDEIGRTDRPRVWIDREGGLSLTKSDIDALQRAKGAVAAAVAHLISKAGIWTEDIQRVCLAGTLGHSLDVANAIFIGLLPPLPLSRFVVIENASLIGAELCATDGRNRDRLERMASGTELHNMADAAGFEELFIEHLHLRQWRGVRVPSSFDELGMPADGLVRAIQYISDMRLEGDHKKMLGLMVTRIFEADLVAFAETADAMRVVSTRAPSAGRCPHEKEILREVAMVIESGFLSTLPPAPGRGAAYAIVPMQVEDRTLAMVIGHDIPEDIPVARLSTYLALARNAGTILTRLALEKELIAHRTRLARLVEERTRELEKANALLRQEMETRARGEEAMRLANKKLNLMSSMTRHDIVNQITILLGYVHLMETKGLPQEKLSRYLGKIEGLTMTIQRLIEFTRDYQDLGLKGPTWQQIDDDFWKAVAAFRDSGLTFRSDVEGLEMMSDQMLNKVFYNLIDNTIRHGDGARHCDLSYDLEGEELILHYRDDGVGIPADVKTLVFERGFGKNTGLGLFLAREILSITGIEIVETGKPGQGVDFAMRVPKGGFRFPAGKAR
jgi:uncharacterized 2Fe-2S/4Fe-4S cluster protein (DUF4445 family)/signal transduction histidine kinase